MIMKTFYKRNLPHYTPEGRVFFITSRLVGSLPKTVIENLKKEKQKNEKFIGDIKNIKLESTPKSLNQSLTNIEQLIS